MRWIRRLFLLACVLATCVIVWAGIYTRRQGFTESWRNAIEAEFEKRGYHLDIGKITLGAFRGLVAEDVRFFRDAARTEEMAFLDDVNLDVDLSRILSKKVSVNSLNVREASLRLPLDPGRPRGRQFRVEDLSGRVVITESMIEILEAEASVAGVDLEITGSLLRSLGETAEEVTEKRKGDGREVLTEWRRQFQIVLRELGEYEFLGEAPRVSLEFRGDLDDLATTTAEATVEASRFRREGRTYEVEELSARVRFDGLASRAEVEELLIRDARGELTLNGTWRQETNRFDFAVESDADLAHLAQWVWRDRQFGEVVFFHPPEIEARGHVALDRIGEEDFGFPGEILGQFRAERFVTRGTVFTGIDCGFSVAGRDFYIRNLRLDHQSGVAFLNLKREAGKGEKAVQYQAEIKLDPVVFRPFLDEEGRQFLDRWDFGESSLVYLAAVGRGRNWDPATWSHRGVIDLRGFRLNGVPFREVEADFESKGTRQWFREVSLVREEGRIEAELVQHESDSDRWEVKGAVSTVDTVAGARAFHPGLAEALQGVRFEEVPTIELAGTLDGRQGEQLAKAPRSHDVEISFASEGTARCHWLGTTLEFDRPSGRISVDGSRVHLTSLEAGLLGGRLELEYDARDVHDSPVPFDASASLSGVPLEAIARLHGDTDANANSNANSGRGTLDAVVNLSGHAGDVSTLGGHGSVSTSGAPLSGLPLLGPLSGITEGIEWGAEDAGERIVHEAEATLRIEEGVVRSDDLEVSGDTFCLRAAGSVSLEDRSIDLEAVVDPRGESAGGEPVPVGELLTYSGSGPATDPEWRATPLFDLRKLPVSVIAELSGEPPEDLEEIVPGLFGARGQPREREKRTEIGGARSGDSDRDAPAAAEN